MKKWLTSILIVVLCLFVYSFTPTKAQTFRDVSQKHANYEHVAYLLEKGVIEATSPNYGIADIVTREEVAVMISKARGLDGAPRQTVFTDVPKSNPNSGYIQSAYEMGIINGYGDGKFQPKTKVTRGHMAAFIARAFTLPDGRKSFSDVKVGSTSFEAVSQLVAAGITTGYGDGTFKPNAQLTRGHISAFLARAIQFQQQFEKSGQVLIHFIDVGQGDSTLLQLPNGQTILVDAGIRDNSAQLINYLQLVGLKKIDVAVATHPDADHIGGFIEAIKVFEIGQFINSGKMHTTATYEQLLRNVTERKIPYLQPEVGTELSTDRSVSVKVIAVNPNAEDTNDASIVLKVTYNKVSYLLMADAGQEIEAQLMKTTNVQASILKAGHHGSSSSSSLAFLQKVQPKTIMLSYGKGNEYGHPHREVVANITKIGAKTFATATDGTIVSVTDGQVYRTTKLGTLLK